MIPGRLSSRSSCRRSVPLSCDFMISYFNCGTVETLPIAIYSMTRKKVSPEIYALSTIMFVVILSVILVSNAMESRSYRKDQKTLRGEGA